MSEIETGEFGSESDEQRHGFGSAMARIGLGIGLIAASCTIEGEPNADIATPEIAEMVAEVYAPDEELAEESTTSSSSTSTNPSTTTSSTTSTTVGTTTTSEEPQPDWIDKVWVDNGCDEGQTLPLRVVAEDGRNIMAQVSWDLENVNTGQKVDMDGNPIERFISYSGHTIINPGLPPEGSFTEGIDGICLENLPPNVVVHTEVYPMQIDYSENPLGDLTYEETYFGGGRSGGIYPGPRQVAVTRLAQACVPEQGFHGDAGDIKIAPFVAGEATIATRAVAWAYWEPHMRYGTTLGFGAEDTLYKGTEVEDTVFTLQPGQKYITQFRVQNPDGSTHEVVIDHVPVDPCQQTTLETHINPTSNTCTAYSPEFDQGFDCSLDRYIG